MIKLIKNEKTILSVIDTIKGYSERISKEQYIELSMNPKMYEKYISKIRSNVLCEIRVDNELKNNEFVIEIVDL
jgi:hypothetical protein